MGVCLQNASPVIGASVTRSNKYIDLPAPENLSTCSSVYSQPPGASKIERSVRAPRCARLARGLEDDYPVPASRCVRSLPQRCRRSSGVVQTSQAPKRLPPKAVTWELIFTLKPKPKSAPTRLPKRLSESKQCFTEAPKGSHGGFRKAPQRSPPPKARSLGDDPKRHESHIGSNNTPRDAVTWEL